MVLRMDEVINHKANKHALDQLCNESRSFANQETVIQKEKEGIKRTDMLNENLEVLKSEFLFFTSNLQKDISNIVRKQTQNIRNQLLYHKGGSGNHEEGGEPSGPNSHNLENANVSVKASELRRLIDNKIDKIDLEMMIESKASKLDT